MLGEYKTLGKQLLCQEFFLGCQQIQKFVVCFLSSLSEKNDFSESFHLTDEKIIRFVFSFQSISFHNFFIILQMNKTLHKSSIYILKKYTTFTEKVFERFQPKYVFSFSD
jgi:hypothetical protein